MTDLPVEVTEHPLREESAWIALRDSGISPRDSSEMLTTQRARDEFLTGAWLLNATTRNGLLNSITPQMLQAVDVLTAAQESQILISALLMPRRSGKTTVAFCVLLGRCYLNPVHYAGFALLTTQKKTSERYRLDVYGPIVRQWPDEETRPVKVIRSNGNERVEFKNGSNLAVLSPEGDAIRSGAYDTLLLDEGGEASPERWEDVISAVIPSFDTRPEGQLILAGTAGDYREGSTFWDTLNDENAGRLNFSIPDDTDPELLETWDTAEALILSMHPGIGTLTTLERIKNNFNLLGVKKFTREYFNLFGAEGSNVALIPQPKWLESISETALDDVELPEVFALSTFVHPDALYASVAASWLDEEGKTHVALLWHQEGVQGFSKKLLLLARKHKRAIIFDTASNSTQVEMGQIRESTPRPSEKPQLAKDISRAAVHFMNTLNQGKLVHYNQEELNGAVEIAVKRTWGDSGSWAFGMPKKANRIQRESDITGLEAVALAAYVVKDEKPTSTGISIDFF
ncbi:hypothetical protein [Microbacterium sp. PRC9]|uniref:hypothetical protein n=1 Tax=Microbacterium sp. PRC9 TaxID=2962591 RepID=UPI002880DB37|nr:hypothetical protein [Microbacterium sp. PRC9]MDT0142788.1 hypothetical protein [Microbacterium sp. PRC9]